VPPEQRRRVGEGVARRVVLQRLVHAPERVEELARLGVHRRALQGVADLLHDARVHRLIAFRVGDRERRGAPRDAALQEQTNGAGGVAALLENDAGGFLLAGVLEPLQVLARELLGVLVAAGAPSHLRGVVQPAEAPPHRNRRRDAASREQKRLGVAEAAIEHRQLRLL
jgi:hypothetical protein